MIKIMTRVVSSPQDVTHSNTTGQSGFLNKTHSLSPPPSNQKTWMVSHCIMKSQLYQNPLCMILAPNSFPRVIFHCIFSNTSSYIPFIFICPINKHPCSSSSTYICVPLLKSAHVLIHLSKHSTNLTFSKDISQLKLTIEYSFSMVLVCPL